MVRRLDRQEPEMKRAVLLVAALTLAPLAAVAAEASGPSAAMTAPATQQCLLDPAQCQTVERSKHRQ
jgi:hypothetical protein